MAANYKKRITPEQRFVIRTPVLIIDDCSNSQRLIRETHDKPWYLENCILKRIYYRNVISQTSKRIN